MPPNILFSDHALDAAFSDRHELCDLVERAFAPVEHLNRVSLSLSITLSLTVLRTAHPEGGIAAAGVLLGLERSLTDAFSFRAVASLARGVFMPDDIALCHRVGEGCLPDAVFPLLDEWPIN